MSGLKLLGRQLSRYSAVGALNTFVGGLLIYFAHHVMGLGIVMSNVIGYGSGLAISYFGNKRWTFAHTQKSNFAPIAYGVLIASAFSSNLGVTFGLIAAGLSYNTAQLFGIAVYSAIVFIGMKFVLFKEQKR